MKSIASITNRIASIEKNQNLNEYDHLSEGQLRARIEQLGHTLGESLSLGRAVTKSEFTELCEKAGIECPR